MMYEVTLFLASVWGPVLVVFGVGILMSKSYYIKMYRNLENETLALMFAALAMMAAGIVHVLAHNVWDSLETVIISLLGWAMLLKGVVLAVYPRTAAEWGNRATASQYFSYGAGAAIILGGYLTMISYFSF